MARWLAIGAALALGARASVDGLRAVAELEVHALLTGGERASPAMRDAIGRLERWETMADELLFACALAFLGWLFLRYRALESRRRSPGWALGAWWVPGLNLVEPYRIVREVWAGGAHGRRGRAPWLVFGWWALGLGYLVTLLGTLAAESRAASLWNSGRADAAMAEALRAERLAIAMTSLSSGAALLGAAVVVTIERRLSAPGSR